MTGRVAEATAVVRRLRRAEFPELLRQIHDPPRVLYLRGAGEVELLARPAVAIVGARACSPYGFQVARMLGRELAAVGLVVVSGLARGVDGEAHRGALEAEGVTVAVLGCGIDRDYPAAHRDLARRICERGLVVSEYEPGVEPAPWRFPARKGKTLTAMRKAAFLQCRPCRSCR
jgi:DNA processing protein